MFSAKFYFDNQMSDPHHHHHQELDCESMPMWFLYVCLSKIQLFIKTASMLELTMLQIQEQAYIPYQSLIWEEQCR